MKTKAFAINEICKLMNILGDSASVPTTTMRGRALPATPLSLARARPENARDLPNEPRILVVDDEAAGDENSAECRSGWKLHRRSKPTRASGSDLLAADRTESTYSYQIGARFRFRGGESAFRTSTSIP